MVEERRIKLEQELKKMMTEVYDNYFRKLQAESHKCAAVCYNNKKVSLDKIQKCLDTCSIRLEKAVFYVENRLKEFDTAFEKCATNCRNSLETSRGQIQEEPEVARLVRTYEGCIQICVDKQIDDVPTYVVKKDFS